VQEETLRKVELAKKQALAGNTHEAQKRLAQHSSNFKGAADAPKMVKAGGVNVAKTTQVKTMSHSLYSSSKIAVEFEDEDGLKELCLELRELEAQGDFDWMMLGYAEDKKNTLRLLETGNGGREAVVDYLREDMAGALDRVMYLILKEDYSCSKCTFVYWIGSKVPAFVKANTSTHRGAISEWITRMIHNLQEECVSSGNELLGLKDSEEDGANVSVEGGSSDAVNESTVMQIDSQLHAKPYAGKVLEEVVRDKTPHEIWLERKQAKDSGVSTSSSSSSDRKSSVGGAPAVGGAHQFTQVVLKKNDPGGKPKSAGRSKWSQKKDLASDGGSSEHGSETSESALSSAKTGVGTLAEQARAASEEAERLEKEAALRRAQAKELEERAKKEQLQDVMGEEPDWSPDDVSDADVDGEDYRELGADATVTNEVERTRSDADEQEVKARAESQAKATVESEAAAAAQKRAQEEEEAKKEALRKEEEEAARRKEQEEARLKEEEAARRKEQEEAALARLKEDLEEAKRRQAEEEERARVLKEQEVLFFPHQPSWRASHCFPTLHCMPSDVMCSVLCSPLLSKSIPVVCDTHTYTDTHIETRT